VGRTGGTLLRRFRVIPIIKILFLADTHLGFDLPLYPRIKRRRRGVDFFQNYRRVLEPALNGKVDVVIHGGDLFYRSRIPAVYVTEAFNPLLRIADRGIPVFIVPGNHERSRVPNVLFIEHPHIFIFDRPKTFRLKLGGLIVSLSGFPSCRNSVRVNFKDLLDGTEYVKTQADVKLLCMHQIVEGSKVGPGDYTFKNSTDVIEESDIPRGFAAVLSGHIHRYQVLRVDLNGTPLSAPVIYPGSIERTSFAERYEKKGYTILEVAPSGLHGGAVNKLSFIELPTRPMFTIELNVAGLDSGMIRSELTDMISALNPDGVISVKILNGNPEQNNHLLGAEFLRSLAPSTMNINTNYSIRG
jgi:DNA repair exonuclease SbcCD nuclease subunit